jgi:hypothetical protein
MSNSSPINDVSSKIRFYAHVAHLSDGASFIPFDKVLKDLIGILIKFIPNQIKKKENDVINKKT